jgi:hypothetical protein
MNPKVGYFIILLIIILSVVGMVHKVLGGQYSVSPQLFGYLDTNLLVAFIFLGLTLLTVLSGPKSAKIGWVVVYLGVVFNRLIYWIYPQQLLIMSLADVVTLVCGLYGLIALRKTSRIMIKE